jgi:hypothetical protein
MGAKQHPFDERVDCCCALQSFRPISLFIGSARSGERPLMELPRGLKSRPLTRTDVIGCRSHFAVSRFLSFVVFRGHRRACLPEGLHSRIPARLAFLQSIGTVEPSRTPQRRGSSRGLLLPTAPVRFEGPLLRQVSTPVYVPPSGFGYPLDGLLPSSPSGPCFRSTAPMGFAPSEFFFPRGIGMLPSQCTHLLFLLRFLRLPKLPLGHADRSSWAFTLTGSTDLRPVYSPGVHLSRVLPAASLGPPFGRPPLMCFARVTTRNNTLARTSEYRSTSTW